MPAGELRERLSFQKREAIDDDASPQGDDYGNTEGDFATQFTVAARVRPRLGGETILAQRLAGVKPVNITVRHSTDTVQITTAWRAIDARDATKIYNLRSVINPDERRRYIEILAEEGPAT